MSEKHVTAAEDLAKCFSDPSRCNGAQFIAQDEQAAFAKIATPLLAHHFPDNAALVTRLRKAVDESLQEIAFHVPIVTTLGNIRVCDVEEVFKLKRIAADARKALAGSEAPPVTDVWAWCCPKCLKNTWVWFQGERKCITCAEVNPPPPASPPEAGERPHEGACGPEAGCDMLCVEAALQSKREPPASPPATLPSEYGLLRSASNVVADAPGETCENCQPESYSYCVSGKHEQAGSNDDCQALRHEWITLTRIRKCPACASIAARLREWELRGAGSYSHDQLLAEEKRFKELQKLPPGYALAAYINEMNNRIVVVVLVILTMLMSAPILRRRKRRI
jgi:hypothetical protein